MKKVFYFLLLAFVASQNLSAQNQSTNPFDQSDAVSNGAAPENVWKSPNQNGNSFSTASKTPVGPIKPGGTTSAPIDGGVVLLLAAGALYGRKKYAGFGKAKHTTS